MEGTRAVIYARFSSEKQTVQSIVGQVKICREYAADKGYTVLRVYKDEAQTGKTDDRLQLQKMLKDSEKNQFDIVLVYALDRFGRNIYQCLKNEFELQSNGVIILSATEHFENTPAGRFQRNMMLSNSQYFSEELGLKTARGMTINAENFYSNGGTLPLGYKLEKINPKSEKSKKIHVVDEETAPIVKEIFTKYASGESKKEICESLNARGLTSSKGQAFNKSSMNTMLGNRKYLGIYIYGGKEYEGGMPQIINQDLFEKVQERLRLNKQAPARARAKEEYLLTTKLFCGHCKDRMNKDVMLIGHSAISKDKVRYSYYKCKLQGKGLPCDKKMIHKNYIEDIVVNKCREYLTPQEIRRIAKRIVKVAESYDDRTEIDRLNEELHEAQEGETNYLTALRVCKDETAMDIVLRDIGRIGAKIKELERQIEIEKSRRYTISEKKIINTLTTLAESDMTNIVYRKALIRTLVNKIYIYDDKFAFIINLGDEEIEITERLLTEIEENLTEKDFCVLNDRGHQQLPKANPDNHYDCRGSSFSP